MIRTIGSTISRVRVAGLRLLLLAGLVAMCAEVAQAQWTTSSNDIYNSNSGMVGIGTSSPATKFANSATNYLVDSIGIGTNSILWRANEAGYVASFVQDSTNSVAAGVSINIAGTTNNSSPDQNAVLSVLSGDTMRFMVTANGNVGIGTTNPSSTLDVNGNVTVSGNISAKYQDIAEWVPSRRPLVAGTVVIVDSDGTNTVLPSSRSYDTRVAGVVSAMPGIVLGEQGEGKVKVATTGRVKVRVDASQGPVRAGDLLVTSSTEGVAMRSEPMDIGGRRIHQPGTLIGKALEPLSEGEGEILVLLSLQ